MRKAICLMLPPTLGFDDSKCKEQQTDAYSVRYLLVRRQQ